MIETYVYLIGDGVKDGDGVVLDGDRAPKSPWSNSGAVESTHKARQGGGRERGRYTRNSK